MSNLGKKIVKIITVCNSKKEEEMVQKNLENHALPVVSTITQLFNHY